MKVLSSNATSFLPKTRKMEFPGAPTDGPMQPFTTPLKELLVHVVSFRTQI